MHIDSNTPSKIDRICDECGKAFYATRHDVARGYGHFCSRSCSAKSKSGALATNWRGGPIEHICEHCGKAFTTRRYALGKFCSKACVHAHAMPIAERFWAKVRKAAPDSCWVWTAAKDQDGYGLFAQAQTKRAVRASRFAYELVNGSIPSSMVIRHTCDNPPCVNPAHLILGTDAQNCQDKIERNRQAVGSQVASSKLREHDIPTIRELHRSGVPKNAIARRYQVSWTTIDYVVSHRTWKHVA